MNLYLKFLKQSVLFCCLIVISAPILAKEPQNIGELKRELRAYYESGQYRKDTTLVMQEAQHYIRDRIQENNLAEHKKKLAIVLDIDETALSNFKDYHNLNFGGTQEDILFLVEKGNKSALPPTLNLYRFAKSHDIAVFFITSRKKKHEELTVENLRHEGFYNWDGLYMKPDDSKNMPTVLFKTAARKDIIDHGYDIIANIGDQKTDLEGGFADRTFKLPNPFYLSS